MMHNIMLCVGVQTAQKKLRMIIVIPSLFIGSQTFIQVNNYQEERVIYDVIATMYGQVEPDQLVVLGNHRDAWVFGGVDPNSGTAVLEEIARALSNLRTKGWRPGRSLLLCSWDAEEYGLVGSTEWIEVGEWRSVHHAYVLGHHNTFLVG